MRFRTVSNCERKCECSVKPTYFGLTEAIHSTYYFSQICQIEWHCSRDVSANPHRASMSRQFTFPGGISNHNCGIYLILACRTLWPGSINIKLKSYSSRISMLALVDYDAIRFYGILVLSYCSVANIYTNIVSQIRKKAMDIIINVFQLQLYLFSRTMLLWKSIICRYNTTNIGFVNENQWTKNYDLSPSMVGKSHLPAN